MSPDVAIQVLAIKAEAQRRFKSGEKRDSNAEALILALAGLVADEFPREAEMLRTGNWRDNPVAALYAEAERVMKEAE